MFIRNALIAFAVGLCLIGAASFWIIWQTSRDARDSLDANQYTPQPCGPECGYCHPTGLKPGDLDANGNLVIYTAGGEDKILESDYALIHRNIGSAQNPIESFDFFSRESGYEKFSSLDALMERIEKIQQPRVFDTYTSCGGPPWYSLPKSNIEAFDSAMTRNQVEFRYLSTCTCPCPNSK